MSVHCHNCGGEVVSPSDGGVFTFLGSEDREPAPFARLCGGCEQQQSGGLQNG